MERVPRAALNAQSNTGEVRVEHVRRAFDRVVLVDVLDDLVDLLRVVAEALERGRDGLVDDLQHAAADQLLVLHERDVGSMPVVSQSIMKRDRAGRREHGDLRIAIAVLLAEGVRLVPHFGGGVRRDPPAAHDC
jgi:hypothetical protein